MVCYVLQLLLVVTNMPHHVVMEEFLKCKLLPVGRVDAPARGRTQVCRVNAQNTAVV